LDKTKSFSLVGESYRLGQWTIIPRECVIRAAADADGATRKVTPRSMEVLLHLSERAGLVVSSDELLDDLWRGTFATANAVQKCITELRHAFDDVAREPRVLQTIHKRGYKLLLNPMPLELEAQPELPAAETARSPPARARDGSAPRTRFGRYPRYVTGAGAAAAIVAMVIWSGRDAGIGDAFLTCTPEEQTGEGSCRPAPTSIGVLRFATSDDPDTVLYAEGLAELVLTALNQVPHLEVAARRDSMEPSLLPLTTREAGERLDVDHILLGNLKASGDEIRLSVQLVRASTGTELYSDEVVRNRNQLFELYEEVSDRVVGALHIHLNDVERARMLNSGTRNTQAYLENKRAFFLVESGSVEDLMRAAQHARRAVEIDPMFVNAYNCLLIAFERLAPFLGADGAERVRAEINNVVDELKVNHPQSDALQLARVIADRLGDDELALVGRLVSRMRANPDPGLVDPGGIAPYYLFGDVLLRAGLLDEGEAYRRRFADARGYSYTPHYATLMRDEGTEALIAVRKEYVARNPTTIEILGGLIQDLARGGRFAEAHEYLERLERNDREGIWIVSVRHNLLLREGKVTHGGPEYQAIMTNPRNPNATKGHVALLHGDIGAGTQYWTNLTPVERRVLRVNLPFMELDYPKHVLSDPDYVDLKERLGIGDQWRRYLATKVAELEPFTTVQLTTVPPLQVALGD
jgi:TolB-like protein/DNA-binding winged helix-turn-helix (wHTH) protein